MKNDIEVVRLAEHVMKDDEFLGRIATARLLIGMWENALEIVSDEVAQKARNRVESFLNGTELSPLATYLLPLWEEVRDVLTDATMDEMKRRELN